MRISEVIFPTVFPNPFQGTASPARPPVPTTRDTLEISETSRQRIDQLQQGEQALRQAVAQSRAAIRSAAHERVSAAKEYLKILVRLSPAGDRGAAAEAARIAREINRDAADFNAGSGAEGETDLRSEISGFAGVAGDALNIASGLISSYLHNRTSRKNGDAELEKSLSGAVLSVRQLINSALV